VPRDLADAVRKFLGRDHQGAHGALADARATAEFLDRLLACYPDLPRGVDELHVSLTEVDLGDRLRREGDRLLLSFGEYAGRSLEDVARADTGYLAWLRGQQFLPDFKELVARALEAVGGDGAGPLT
jgi:DNA polymerase-3 subunit epsilon